MVRFAAEQVDITEFNDDDLMLLQGLEQGYFAFVANPNIDAAGSAAVEEAADRLGAVIAGERHPRETRVERATALSCRISAELGARVVKTYYCEDFDKITETCPVPVVIAGGAVRAVLELAGVDPAQVHEWYLAVYADAYEWVELPNTLGMALHADGGLMASKPYAASGNYINRMSTYCKGCRYDVKQRTGDDACPFTTLYWDFLERHHERFAANMRMKFQVRNLERKPDDEVRAIRRQAAQILARIDSKARI